MHKNQGFFSVIAAIAVQLTMGLTYVWSVFQTGIADSIFGGNHAAAGLTFSLLIATLGVGSIGGGKLAERYSVRTAVFVGGLMTGVGLIIASFTTPDIPWLIWLAYGLISGIGMGVMYSPTIACAQKWFPHKKGLVTGIIVAAMGLGGVIFTPIVVHLISSFGGQGTGELKTFVVLGVIYLAICCVASIFLKMPPPGMTVKTVVLKVVKEYSAKEMFKTARFYLIVAAFMLASIGGLMMIGFAKPIAEGKGLAAIATVGVIAITMSNSLGRLFWGMLSDKLGRENTVIVLLSGTAVLSLLVNAAAGFWVIVLIALVGFFYGGVMSNFPSLTAETFGAGNLATNYGFVLIGFGAGGIASSQIAGYYKNIATNDISLMFPAFVIASCCAAAGIVLVLILKRLKRRCE